MRLKISLKATKKLLPFVSLCDEYDSDLPFDRLPFGAMKQNEIIVHLIHNSFISIEQATKSAPSLATFKKSI